MARPSPANGGSNPALNGHPGAPSSGDAGPSAISGLLWRLPVSQLRGLATQLDAKSTRQGVLSAEGVKLDGLNWSLSCAPVVDEKTKGKDKITCGFSIRCRSKKTSRVESSPTEAHIPPVALDIAVSLGSTGAPLLNLDSSVLGLFKFEVSLDRAELDAAAANAGSLELVLHIRRDEATGPSAPMNGDAIHSNSELSTGHLLCIESDTITGILGPQTNHGLAVLLNDASTGDLELISSDGVTVYGHSKVLVGWEWIRGILDGLDKEAGKVESAAPAPPAKVDGPATPESPPGPSTSTSTQSTPYKLSSVVVSRTITRIELPIPARVLKTLVEFIYSGRTPRFEPDESGISLATQLYTTLLSYPLPPLLPHVVRALSNSPLVNSDSVCVLLSQLERTPLRDPLITFAASNFSAVVKTNGWNALVFRKSGIPRVSEGATKEEEEAGLKIREETVRRVMEEVARRV